MSSRFESASTTINRHLKKKGVTIFLDMGDSSDTGRSGAICTYDSQSKILTIVVPELKARDKKLLHQIIRRIHNEGGLLWKDTKREALIEYAQYSSSHSDKEVLDFFSAILQPNDISALKMALFLRSQSAKGKNIQSYKMDIRERFGDRGENIANLCSAGYFENEFMPLYRTAPKPEFFAYYEMAVGDEARALFVHSNMDVEDIELQVQKMVQKAQKYHMKDFRVHGKGITNVSEIMKFTTTRTGREGYTIKKVYDDPKLPAMEYVVEINRDGA